MYVLSKGVLIAVEGIDGSGKSTLCANLVQALQSHMPVIQTKEPGGTQLGAHLRAIVQQSIARSPQTEFLLFAADRAQHFSELILPSLAQNNMVISDRMADSSLVYQGYGRGLDRTMISQINAWAMQNRTPDITIYVRIPLETALERISLRNQALTAFEKESTAFTQRLIHGFDTIYANRTDVITVDGTLSPEMVTQNAFERVMHTLTHQKLLS